MKLSNESFYRWKHDPITIAFKSFIQRGIAHINDDLAYGYTLLRLPPEEMAKKLAHLLGRKEAFESMLEIELDDLEENTQGEI